MAKKKRRKIVLDRFKGMSPPPITRTERFGWEDGEGMLLKRGEKK